MAHKKLVELTTRFVLTLSADVATNFLREKKLFFQPFLYFSLEPDISMNNFWMDCNSHSKPGLTGQKN